MLRVIHTADTHIGYRQYHEDARRQDFLAAFNAVIDDAVDEQVDAVIHAGDLFHDKRPDLRDLQGTIAALARLRAADIPFGGIVGNHERKRDAQWLDLFADLDLATRLGSSPTHLNGVAIYGIDYLTPSSRSPDTVELDPPGDANGVLLVGHGIIEGLPYGDWDLNALLDASDVEVHGVLLGDYHEHVLEHRGETVITYPGSTERASADERAPRGYNLVTVQDGEVSVSHRTLPETRSFVYIDVELAANEGENRVRDRIDEYDIEDAVAIVSIDGEGDPVSSASIESHAREAGALVARVRDRRKSTSDDAGDGGISVRFADPDRAVREALVDTELSEATHELDEVVRDDAIPDNRIRDHARATVESLIDADWTSLERTAEPTTPPEMDPETPADHPDGDTQTSSSIDEPDSDPDRSAASADHETQQLTEDPDDEQDDEEAVPASEGQASMGDYL